MVELFVKILFYRFLQFSREKYPYFPARYMILNHFLKKSRNVKVKIRPSGFFYQVITVEIFYRCRFSYALICHIWRNIRYGSV